MVFGLLPITDYLFPLPHIRYTFISGLNDSGQVVGTYVDAQRASHGFVASD